MNRPQFAGRLSAIQNGNQRGVYEEQAMRDIPIVDHQRYRLEYVEFAEILDRRLTAYRNCLSVYRAEHGAQFTLIPFLQKLRHLCAPIVSRTGSAQQSCDTSKYQLSL